MLQIKKWKYPLTTIAKLDQLVVSTQLKNIRQIGSFPQVGMNIIKKLKPPPSRKYMQNAEKVSVSAFTVNTFGRSLKVPNLPPVLSASSGVLLSFPGIFTMAARWGATDGWGKINKKWQQCTPNSSATKKTETAIWKQKTSSWKMCFFVV